MSLFHVETSLEHMVLLKKKSVHSVYTMLFFFCIEIGQCLCVFKSGRANIGLIKKKLFKKKYL